MTPLLRNLYSFPRVKKYYAAKFPFRAGRPKKVVHNICPFLKSMSY